MAFTPFIDNLALVEILLALAAALLAYAGVLGWWAMRNDDPKALRKVLHGVATPAAGIGAVTLVIALWGEMTWPFLTSDGMAGYNIFFFDPLLLLATALIAYAVCAYLGTMLQYAGLLALIVGAAVIFYGYTGYTATPAFTRDPFQTLLLYVAFGAAGIAAFPATVVTDYYLGSVDAGKIPFAGLHRRQIGAGRRIGTRAAQPVVPGVSESKPEESGYQMPIWAHTLMLLFPVIVALAGIAAFWYFGITLPGHLGAGPGAAP